MIMTFLKRVVFALTWDYPTSSRDTKVIPKVSSLNILDNNIFHNLYIDETYILYGLI